jgi:hypothetical protein
MLIRQIRLLTLVVALSSFGASALAVVDKVAASMAPRRHAHVHTHPPHARRHRHHHHHHSKLYGVTPRMMAMAERVSMCEEGGNWHFVGTVFDGGLGWTLGNWANFRKPSWPARMDEAPPHMQANALFRFVRHYGIGMPDQAGVCAGY